MAFEPAGAVRWIVLPARIGPRAMPRFRTHPGRRCVRVDPDGGEGLGFHWPLHPRIPWTRRTGEVTSHGERPQERRSSVLSPHPSDTSVQAPGRSRPDDRRGPAASSARRQRQPLERAAAHGRSGHGELRSGVHPGPDRERAGHAGAGQRGTGSDGAGDVRAVRGMRRADLQVRGSRPSLTHGTVFGVQGSWRVANEAASGRRSRPVVALRSPSRWAGWSSTW